MIRILGIDPSMRNTGLAVVEYDDTKPTAESDAFKVLHCQTIINPQKYKGKDAIMNMIDSFATLSQQKCYLNVDNVIVEAPSVMFSKNYALSTLSCISIVAGAAIALFQVQRCFMFRPNEWNRSRKKEVTHAKTIEFLGDPGTWHYEKKLKSEKHLEHILDAASMALWWIKENYLSE